MEHEEWGERTQATLLIVGAIELLGLALRKFSRVRYVHGLSAAAGLVAVFCVYEAGTAVNWYTPMRVESGSVQAIRRMWSGCCWRVTTIRHLLIARPAAETRRVR